MEHVFCIRCGQKIAPSAQTCPHCGAQQTMAAASPSSPPQAASLPAGTLPEGVKGWSWGAFWLSWIWAIFNKTWIGLLALIPLVNLVMMVILGLKGREWAWRNKTWLSVEHFNRVQQKWSLAGWIFMVVGLLSVIATTVIEERLKHRDNGDFDTSSSWLLDEGTKEESPAGTNQKRADTSPPQVTLPYPMPRLNFGKVDLLGAMKRAGMESPWIAHFTKYLGEPESFWRDCVAQEAVGAQLMGGMNQEEAEAYGETACQSTVQQHHACLNDKALDDAVLCLQMYINDMAEGGD